MPVSSVTLRKKSGPAGTASAAAPLSGGGGGVALCRQPTAVSVPSASRVAVSPQKRRAGRLAVMRSSPTEHERERREQAARRDRHRLRESTSIRPGGGRGDKPPSSRSVAFSS